MPGKGKFGGLGGLVYDAAMKTTKRLFVLCATLLLTQCQSAVAVDEAAQALVTRFWTASPQDSTASAQQLQDAAPDALTLHAWLHAGPQRPQDAPTG